MKLRVRIKERIEIIIDVHMALLAALIIYFI